MKLDDRFGELAERLAGFHEVWVVYLGLELGLLGTLREAGPDGLRPAELAERAGCAREPIETWALAAHAYELVHHDGERVRADQDAAAILLDQDRPEYLGGQFIHAAVASLDYERLLDVYRTGQPVPGRPDRFRTSIERLTVQDIAVFFQEALAALPDLVTDLLQGIRAVDLHCGGGRWLVAMAKRFPNSTFVGVESEPDSVVRARRNVDDAGVAGQVEIVAADVPAIDRSVGTCDLSYFQYALHEGRRSVGSLAAGWAALRPGGRLLALDWCAPGGVESWTDLYGQFVAGIQVDQVFEGSRLPTEQELIALFEEAGVPGPEVIDLPSGATLVVARRPA